MSMGFMWKTDSSTISTTQNYLGGGRTIFVVYGMFTYWLPRTTWFLKLSAFMVVWIYSTGQFSR